MATIASKLLACESESSWISVLGLRLIDAARLTGTPLPEHAGPHRRTAQRGH
jgi:hypothetical protein